MRDEGFKRKLTAIVSADVIGYSRLMRDDEEATVRDLAAHRILISEIIQQNKGRVIDFPGDNILAEFASVVDAVNGAIKIQAEIKSGNADIPEDRRMEFRIGINIGDVIEEEGRIYGDGVNIAARVEGLATGGGIAISGIVYDSIKDKLSLGYHYLGEQNVKNIPEPVRIYRLLTDAKDTGRMIGKKESKSRKSRYIAFSALGLIIVAGMFVVWHNYFRIKFEPDTVEKMAYPFSDKPSIAVLPFDNMSGDPEQEYFSDGISEDIITDLSKISGLIVIARNSSFAYKGKSGNIQQIGRDLKVRYLLEGSIRKAGKQVRINAQLIDATNGQHLWADRYDGVMNDIFTLQDEITRKIISALALKLTVNEQKSLVDKGTENLQAYDAFLKGWQGYRLLSKEGFALAKTHLEKAVELDPEFTRAYAALAILYWKAITYAAPELRQGLGLNNHAAKSAAQAKPQLFLKKAMKKPTALAHGLTSQLYLFRYQHDEALAEIEKAIAMDSNNPEFYAWMSEILWLIGKNREAIESAEMGLRLDPNNPAIYLRQLGRSYLPDGDLEKSLQLLERAKGLSPELSGSVALQQSIIYGIQGRYEEARTSYGIFLESRITPVRNLNDILLYFQFADPKRLTPIADALIKAGAPGSSTDYYRILKKNRISGEMVKSLLFDHKITGIAFSTGKQFGWEWARSGEFKFTMGNFKDKGKSWIEGDILFVQFDKLLGGLPYGTTIYRNPEGSRESKNQYFMVSDIGSITSFAPTDKRLH